MLRTLALGGLGVFVGLVGLQHLSRSDDLPPAEHFISEYARGPGGWVQVVAFLAWGASLAAAAAMAPRRDGRRVAGALVLTGLVAGTIGAVACASFATVTVGGELPAGTAYSAAGRLHDLGSAGIFFGLIVAAVAGVRVVQARGYRLAVLALAALLVIVPAGLIAAGYDAPGWGQRGFVAVGCLWQWRFVTSVKAPWPR